MGENIVLTLYLEMELIVTFLGHADMKLIDIRSQASTIMSRSIADSYL